MKTLIKQIFVFTIMMFCSCNNFIEETIVPNSLDSNELQNEVKNFRTLSMEDPLIIGALNSLNQKVNDQIPLGKSLRVLNNLGDVAYLNMKMAGQLLPSHL